MWPRRHRSSRKPASGLKQRVNDAFTPASLEGLPGDILKLVRGLSDLRIPSYPQGVALIPKGVLGSKRAATFAVVASVVGLAVIPVVTVPAMLLAGFSWHSAPRWARATLIIGGVFFAAYLLALKPAGQTGHH